MKAMDYKRNETAFTRVQTSELLCFSLSYSICYHCIMRYCFSILLCTTFSLLSGSSSSEMRSKSGNKILNIYIVIAKKEKKKENN